MPRPGHLTKGRAKRAVKTPGGRIIIHRRKIYRTCGTCALSGAMMHLPKNANQDRLRRSSLSSKRSNRPYGGYASAHATRRGIIKATRNLHK